MKPILLVEDNEDDITLTTRALKKANLVNQVVVVRDGPEALRFLQAKFEKGTTTQPDVPILILLDLGLPSMDGLEVLDSIRRDDRTKVIPVVILTASESNEDLEKSHQLGIIKYIRKPVNIEKFIGVIGELGLYVALLNQIPSSPF